MLTMWDVTDCRDYMSDCVEGKKFAYGCASEVVFE
jgi:hypothetical protein